MNGIKSEMICIFCSNKFTERKQLLKGKLPRLNQNQSKTFLICQICGTNACHSCVTMIFNAIPKKDKSNDEWSQFLHNNISKLNIENVNIPVGHCCELKYSTDSDKKKTCKQDIMEMNTQTSHPKKTTCKVQKKRKRTKSQNKKERSNRKYWKNLNKYNQTVKESSIYTK